MTAEIMPHLEIWLQTPLAGALGWALFHSLWEGAIIAVALAATLAMTRSARARYLAACLAMCAILLCFGVTLLRLAPGHPMPGAVRNSIALSWNDRVTLADVPASANAPHSQTCFRGWFPSGWRALSAFTYGIWLAGR